MTTDALEAVGLSPADAFEQGIVPALDEVCRAVDHARVDPWVVAGATVAIGNISELALAAQVGATAEIRSCLPVHNTPCMEALAERGAGAFWLSPEITLDEIVSLGAAAPAALGITVFGRPRVMTSEHCILQVANGCIHDCASCRLRARKLSLKNIDGKVMPVRTDIHGRSRLYDAYPIDLTPQVHSCSTPACAVSWWTERCSRRMRWAVPSPASVAPSRPRRPVASPPPAYAGRPRAACLSESAN